MGTWNKNQGAVTARASGAKTASATINNVAQGSIIPIIIGVTNSGTFPSAISVSDSFGDFVFRAIPARLDGGSSPDLAFYYIRDVSAGNHTITVNLGPTDNCNIELIVGPEWSGGFLFDVSSTLSALSSGTTITGPSITTTAGSDLVIFAACQGGVANTYTSFNNSFTLEANQQSGPGTFLADVVQASPGAIAGSCTSNVSNIWVSGQMAFLLSTGLNISLIDNGDSGSSGTTGVTQRTVQRNHYVAAGDLLVAIVLGTQDNNITSVSDGDVGNMVTGGNASSWNSSTSSYSQVYWTIAQQNYNADVANVVTVNFSSSTTHAEIIYAQFRPSAGYAFYPVAGILGASVSNNQTNPGTGVGSITSGVANVPQSPMMALGFSLNNTGSNGPTDDNSLITNNGVNTFTANGGNMIVSYGVLSSAGNQSMLWTDATQGGTNTFMSMFLALNVSNPQAMPLFFREEFNLPNRGRVVPYDVPPASMALLGTQPSKPPPTPPDFSNPLLRSLHVSVTTTADQQQQVVGAPLYGQDRVLVPNKWDYRWQTGVASMPVALRSDNYPIHPGVLGGSVFTLPPGVADQAYTGSRVLMRPSYEFPLLLTIYGKDSTTGGVGAPFLNIDWPVPQRKQVAASIYEQFVKMLALNTFTPTRPPINQTDWPNPQQRRYPVADFWYGLTRSQMAQLLTYPPFPEFDTRVPRGPNPVWDNLYSWEWWQEQTTTQYPPFINADWPVPPGALRPALSFEKWFQWGLLTPPAVLAFDWQNPLRPRQPYELYNWEHHTQRSLFTPPPKPENYDWPNPIGPRTFVRNLSFDVGTTALYLPASATASHVLTQYEVYLLVNAGLQPQVQYAYSNVPVDYVVATIPPQGTVLPVNTPVLVISSWGPPNPGPVGQQVPNVVGLSASQAVALLSAAYLSLGTITWEADALVGAGIVIAQSLPAGSFANPGTIVNLTMSQGTAPPDYLGSTGTIH